MAKLDFLLQGVSDRFHAEELKKLFTHADCKSVLGSVAFALQEGISAIAPQLKDVAQHTKFFVGIRNDITSVQAVKALLALGVRVFAVDTGSSSVIFHPKLFIVEGKTTARMLIGSANMTFSGLHNNIEAGAVLDFDFASKEEKEFVENIFKTFDELPGRYPDHVFQIKDTGAADALFNQGRLSDEDVSRARLVFSALRKGGRDSLRAMPLKKHAPPSRKRVSIKARDKTGATNLIEKAKFVESEVKINRFFEEVLGVKLRHSQQAWGAVDSARNRVFLRIWENEIKSDENGEVVKIYWKPQVGVSSGYHERREQIEAIRNGAKGFGIVCVAADTTDPAKRKIKLFYKEPLLCFGEIVEDKEGIYAKVIGHSSLAELDSVPSVQLTDFVLVWESNGLTERDLNIPSGSTTKKTGSMLWKKGAVQDIDQRHFFRDEVFGGLDWTTDPEVRHYERAKATFQIIIKGVNYGLFVLKLSHNTKTDTKSYKDKNSMTQIHWGIAKKHIAQPDLLGREMSLYRREGTPPDFIIEID